MLRINWIHIALAVTIALIVLFAIRVATPTETQLTEQGRLFAQAWCTECHSVERETAGTGKFAPDFTVIAKRRTAHWLNVFLRSEHVKMPDFVFKPNETDAIVTYILSLKRS